MGLLLLLTSTLLSSYFQSGGVVNAQSFTISSITLSIEPSADVPRDTNVTLRCKAKVLILGSEALTRKYVIYKGKEMVDSRTTGSSEDFLSHLFNARVSDSGKYRCEISIENQQKSSQSEKLTVTGLSKPVLHLTKNAVIEGDELTVSCSAPGETGSILVYFYDNSKEIHEVQMNPANDKIRLKGAGSHDIHCSYTVVLTPDSVKSEESNMVHVTVRELSIAPVLEIFPEDNIYEGDPLNITCTVRNFLQSSESVQLILGEGSRMLGTGAANISHNMAAPASVTRLTFECSLTVNNVNKIDTKTVSVAELFSEPTLTMSPPQVFQRDAMMLICRSQRVATGKLDRTELTYTLHPPENHFLPKNTGEFTGKALLRDFNYTCVAQARNIEKSSKILTVRPKVYVSTPEISVYGRVILGQPFQIRCRSFSGSLPITYMLYKEYIKIDSTTIEDPSDDAFFTVTIYHPDEINKYFCEATNKGREGPLSKALNASVIVPPSQVNLTTVPDLENLLEGSNLHLLCTARGTPPITFRWYRVGASQPLNTTTSQKNFKFYEVPVLTKQHSGKYFCEASNPANIRIKSMPINIEVQMAVWKKAAIGGTVLLVVALVLVLVGFKIYFRSKRGQRETAAELSVKPSSPKSDDSLTVTLTHDTEVYNAATVRVNGTAVSVWSDRKPEADNDEEGGSLFNEPDVEYTEVVHPRSADPDRAPLKKGTDTVYSELQNSSHGPADHHDYVGNYRHEENGSIEYADLNGEQVELSQYHPEVHNYPDLPVPVD